MCKKQTAVSHSSTESEIISLDTGLRLDGLPALELWDLIVSVFGNISHISDRTGKPVNGEDKHQKSHNKIDSMKDIDSVPSNVQSARQEALLYVFEDNEAVIKMIMKGRSPTMRHVSRTVRRDSPYFPHVSFLVFSSVTVCIRLQHLSQMHQRPRWLKTERLTKHASTHLYTLTPQFISQELTGLLLIGCSIELIWTPKSKSKTSTPKTNSQTS